MTDSPHQPTPGDQVDADSDARVEPLPAADSTEEAVARGRATETPFVLLGGVATVIWLVVALVAAALLLVWWLG
jgi:disulfide bond formation protein DsbB